MVLFAAVFVAQVVVVGLATVRSIVLMRTTSGAAPWISGVQAVLAVVVLSQIVTNLADVWVLIAFGFGNVTGTFVGQKLEQVWAPGVSTVRIISPHMVVLAEQIREAGWQVTVFNGSGRSGEVGLLFVVVARKHTKPLLEFVSSHDPDAFWTVGDTSGVRAGLPAPGWLRSSFVPRAVPSLKPSLLERHSGSVFPHRQTAAAFADVGHLKALRQ